MGEKAARCGCGCSRGKFTYDGRASLRSADRYPRVLCLLAADQDGREKAQEAQDIFGTVGP